MEKYSAIEITTPTVFDLVKSIAPLYADIDYADVHHKFAVFGYPSVGDTTILSPAKCFEICDHIENGVQIRIKHLMY